MLRRQGAHCYWLQTNSGKETGCEKSSIRTLTICAISKVETWTKEKLHAEKCQSLIKILVEIFLQITLASSSQTHVLQPTTETILIPSELCFDQLSLECFDLI